MFVPFLVINRYKYNAKKHWSEWWKTTQRFAAHTVNTLLCSIVLFSYRSIESNTHTQKTGKEREYIHAEWHTKQQWIYQNIWQQHADELTIRLVELAYTLFTVWISNGKHPLFWFCMCIANNIFFSSFMLLLLLCRGQISLAFGCIEFDV